MESIQHGEHNIWEGPTTVLTPGDFLWHTSAACIPNLLIHKPSQLALPASTNTSPSTAHILERLSLSALTALYATRQSANIFNTLHNSDQLSWSYLGSFKFFYFLLPSGYAQHLVEKGTEARGAYMMLQGWSTLPPCSNPPQTLSQLRLLHSLAGDRVHNTNPRACML